MKLSIGDQLECPPFAAHTKPVGSSFQSFVDSARTLPVHTLRFDLNDKLLVFLQDSLKRPKNRDFFELHKFRFYLGTLKVCMRAVR